MTEAVPGIRLRSLEVAFPVAIVAFLGVIAAALWLVASSFTQVGEVLENRRQTLALTSELTRITELLARLVRAYSATGDTRYLTYYYELAEYRNGKKAGPAGDPIQYWEEVVAGLRRHENLPDIAGKSFPQRMREAGFSSDELVVLDRALADSEELHKKEQIAFAATQGLFDPEKGDFVSDGKPNIEYAIKLVHSPEYAKLQAGLNVGISNLARLADTRTQASVEESTTRLLRAIVLAASAMGALLVLTLLASFFIHHYVLNPIQKTVALVDRMARGEYQSRLVPSQAVRELNILANGFNQMAEAIEEDIKRRQQVQAELEHARSIAVSATEAKSMFLANMSHELRTPMNAILGFSEMLEARYFGELTEKQAEYVNDINESGKHLLALINDILDLSKVEAGRMELELSLFDLPDALGSAMTLVKERATRHGIGLNLSVDPALGAFCADERKFKQVMLNLLSNAVKFTPDGGSVSVTARPLDSSIEVSVIDTGVGIAHEDQDAVFQEFRQVGADARKAEGTGLGLALVKRFVELHGGSIRVESAPGQGSTFTFILPARGDS